MGSERWETGGGEWTVRGCRGIIASRLSNIYGHIGPVIMTVTMRPEQHPPPGHNALLVHKWQGVYDMPSLTDMTRHER